MSWSEEKISETAQNLVDARLAVTSRTTFPGDVPPDLPTAYAVQSSAIRKWPDQLVGFKVGGIAERFRDQFPSEWIAGPIFHQNVFNIKSDEILDFPVFPNGFAAFEPELIFQISTTVSRLRDQWTPDMAKKIIERIFLGAEIASSPNINVNALGPGSIISDFGNNGGNVLGKELELSELDSALSLMTETRINGESVGRKKPAMPPSGPLGALCFLLNHLNTKGDLYDLPDKLIVSSGAITGVHESTVGAVGEMEYEGVQTLGVKFVPKPLSGVREQFQENS